jgi:hypothetical protein
MPSSSIKTQFDLGSHCDTCDVHCCVSVYAFKKGVLIDVRDYNVVGEEYLNPTKTGITISVSQFNELKRIMRFIEASIKVAENVHTKKSNINRWHIENGSLSDQEDLDTDDCSSKRKNGGN